MSANLLDIATDPGLQRQLERSRERLVAVPVRRERRAEVLAAGLFVFASVGLFVSTPNAAPPLIAAVVLVLAYAAVMSVEFEIGAGYTAPSVLVLIPMLYLLPAASVPLCVAAGHLIVYVINVARRRRSLARVTVVLGLSLYALGPALVFTVLAPGTAGWNDLPVVLAAFVAYVACDSIASLGVDHFGYREPLRPLLRSALWVYLVDLLLFPVGLVVTIAAGGDLAPIAVLVPLCGLLALFAGERRHRLDGALELSRAYRGTAMLLGDLVESDDHNTGIHSRDVVDLALGVARRLGLNEVQLRTLEFGALLHDVGKIAVPKEILNKPGPLDDEEWKVMRAHTIEGQRMLDSVGGVLAEVGRVVRGSHERWDGHGYPDGLAGDQIPLESRICNACDAYSAMTTDRAYRVAMSREAAVAELWANAGSQFDPSVAEALIAELTAP